MSRVGKRALINFIVDTAIAAAFIVSAVSGLVFLVPAGWLSVGGSTTSALGIDYTTWRTVHDWTAVIMIVGVVLHTALHWGWVKTMVRRLAGGGRALTRPAGDGRAMAPPVGDRPVEPVLTMSVPADTTPGGDTREAETHRLTRTVFLKRVGAVGAAALVGGIVGRSAATALGGWFADGSTTSETASAVEEWSDDLGSSGSTDSSGSNGTGSASSGYDQSGGASASAARVSIDAGRCTGCGECLRACPFGVFSSNGGQAVVADAEACRLCGHCLQVCRAGAITLNG